MNSPRRQRLIAFFLPVAGLLLIMPPIVLLFDHRGTIFGVPAIIAFLFLVWLGLILATLLVQRGLRHIPTRPPERIEPR